MSELAIGMRVRILIPLVCLRDRGVIYNHYSKRHWPWHVRPDDWPCDDFGGGIAFAKEKLEPEREEQHENR
jgi:hypothetical protein